VPEPGDIYRGEFRPEFLEDEEKGNSARAYLQKLRRFLTEAIVERYFILTPRCKEHFDCMP
jgi:hypothetical protein